ncbi:hypothetical protein SCOR_02705 [Sulfidibacter corallicola]
MRGSKKAYMAKRKKYTGNGNLNHHYQIQIDTNFER